MIRAIDRVSTLIFGLTLLGAGLAAILWQSGWTATWFTMTDRLDSSALQAMMGQTWWPWVTGAAGAVLVVLGLAWLLRHLPRRTSTKFALMGSDDSGTLHADLSDVADAAAAQLEAHPDVRKAHGHVTRDRAGRAITVDAVIEPTTDLAALASVADDVGEAVTTALGEQAAPTVVHLRSAKTARTTRRLA